MTTTTLRLFFWAVLAHHAWEGHGHHHGTHHATAHIGNRMLSRDVAGAYARA